MPRLFALGLLTATISLCGLTSSAHTQPNDTERQPNLRIETGMHTAIIRKLDVDAANRFLVTASDDKTVRVWELPSGQLQRVLRVPIGPGNEGKLFAVAISPDGKTIVTGGYASVGAPSLGTYIYWFDRESGRMIRRSELLGSVVLHLTYSADGKYLAATLGGTQGVRVFRSSDNSIVGADTDYGDQSHSADFDLAGNLATVSYDGFVRLYGPIDKKGLQLRTKKKMLDGDKPLSVKFNPNGTRLAVASVSSERVAVLDGTDLAVLFLADTSAALLGDFSLVVWSADGSTLYAKGSPTYSANLGFVRAWSDGGRGRFRDLTDLSLNAVTGLIPLRKGGFVYGASDPAFGVVDATDRRILFVNAGSADFRSNVPGFRLAPDGTGVLFAFERYGKSPGRFNFSARKLESTAVGETVWPAPVTEDKDTKLTDVLGYSPKINGTPIALESQEVSRCVAFSPDRGSFLIGADYYLRLFDRNGALKWKSPNPTIVWSLNISADGRVAVGAFADGTIRWYRMRDGKELLALFPHPDRKRWVAWTPEGYYDASPGAEDLIGWQVNNGADKAADFYPIGQFFERYYHPKLLAQVLTLDGVRPPSAGGPASPALDRELKRPPLVRIVSPKPGASVTGDSVQFSVEAIDQGGGVDEIRLYQNDKLVSNDTRQLVQVAGNVKLFNVTLLPGANFFRATAFNLDRTEANPVELQIDLKAARAESDLYILAVGLNDYKNTKYSLNYGRADAQAFADTVEQRAKSIFRHIDKQVVLDERATRNGIEEAFAKIIAKAKPQDALVFYFAGHGVMSEGSDSTAAEFYLVPYDVVQLYGNDNGLASRGVAARLLKDLSTKVRAQKQLIVLDACQSAGALETFAVRGAAEEKAVQQLARSAGVVVLSATGQDQVATEFGKLGHGVFTFALLQALNGDADGGNPPDGKITANEIIAFINDRVPELTKQYRGKTQYPNAWSRGQDFPLGVK